MTAIILCAGLLGLVLFGTQGPARMAPGTPVAEQLVALRRDEIKQIEIAAPTFRLAVEKADLEQAAVAAFRAHCCPLLAKRKVAEKATNLAQYGLMRPRWVIRLNRQERALEIGALNQAARGYYARWSGSKTVYLIDSGLATYLPRKAQDWLKQ